MIQTKPFRPFQNYYMRYTEWHVDPQPYLFVIWSDRKYTTGFNLHYLPNIRFRIPVETYVRTPEKQWKKAFENMQKAGMFRGFLKILVDAKENPISKAKAKAIVEFVSHRYPWAMESFRKYHTDKLMLRLNINQPS